MGFWLFLLVCDCLVPALMIVFGQIMWKHCSKKINPLFGYRTKLSMKNETTWTFAHHFAGKLWWRLGLFLLPVSLLLHLPFYGADADMLGILSLVLVAVQCVALLATIFFTERALRKTFTPEGTRR